MSGLNMSTVTVTKEVATNSLSSVQTTTQETILNGVLRRVGKMPNQKVFQYLGTQVDAGAYYYLRLQPGDPNLPQGANVTAVFPNGFTMKGQVKSTAPMTYVVDNSDREVYIQSNNQ